MYIHTARERRQELKKFFDNRKKKNLLKLGKPINSKIEAQRQRFLLDSFNKTLDESSRLYNCVKEENLQFSKDFTRYSNLIKKKHYLEKTFISLITHYRQKKYKIPDLSLNHNIFKQNPLLLDERKLSEYYKYQIKKNNDSKRKNTFEKDKATKYLLNLQKTIEEEKIEGKKSKQKNGKKLLLKLDDISSPKKESNEDYTNNKLSLLSKFIHNCYIHKNNDKTVKNNYKKENNILQKDIKQLSILIEDSEFQPSIINSGIKSTKHSKYQDYCSNFNFHPQGNNFSPCSTKNSQLPNITKFNNNNKNGFKIQFNPNFLQRNICRETPQSIKLNQTNSTYRSSEKSFSFLKPKTRNNELTIEIDKQEKEKNRTCYLDTLMKIPLEEINSETSRYEIRNYCSNYLGFSEEEIKKVFTRNGEPNDLLGRIKKLKMVNKRINLIENFPDKGKKNDIKLKKEQTLDEQIEKLDKVFTKSLGKIAVNY